MKSNKTLKFALILLIAVAAYNLVFFMLAGFADHTATFWESWGFMMLAIATIIIVFASMGSQGMFMRDWLFGYPIFKHCTIYAFVELVLSSIFAIFEESVSWSVALVIQILLYAIFLVFTLSAFLARDTIKEIGAKVEVKTQYIRLLRVDAEMLEGKCTDPAPKEKCRKFAEDVRFSDPMSNEVLFELEKEISLTVSNCDMALSANNFPMADALLTKASLLLQERNKKCKVLK